MRLKLFTVILLSVILLSYQSVSAKRKKKSKIKDEGELITVISEGIADIDKSGISGATDNAIADAQHKAIEQALGRMYSARTVVEAGRFLEQTVMANVKGYIKKWDKLEGPTVKDFPGVENKIVWVKIEAVIGKDKLKDDTLALEETQNRLGRPDIAIAIKNEAARNIIAQKLTQHKFTVKDIDLSADDIRTEAVSENIELLIEGDITANKSSESSEELYGVKRTKYEYQANVTYKAVNVASNEILSESSDKGALWHLEEEMAKNSAIKRAATPAADDIIEKLIKAWEHILDNGSGIYLKVEGLKLADESSFKHVLMRYIRGVKEVHGKGFKDGIFTYKIMFLGDARKLAKFLDSMESGYEVAVLGYSSNNIDIKVGN